MRFTYKVPFQFTRVLSAKMELSITGIGEILHEGRSRSHGLNAGHQLLFFLVVDWGGLVMVIRVEVGCNW
jgi:hypothetical protein